MKSFLLSNWKFHYKDCPDAWYKGFRDDDWKEVTIPHDWSVHMPFSKEYSSGTGYLAGGIGWYRTTFSIPMSFKNKKIYITFDGVYKNSQVWCNSYYLGKRPFGYATFSYDITEQIDFDNDVNVITVKVDHSDISDSRWFTGSGIQRKVTITAHEQVHPEHNGIFFKTNHVTLDSADVEINNTIVNETSSEVNVIIENRLLYKNSESLLVCGNITIPANSSKTLINKDNLVNPALWSPTSPNLYCLETTIKYYSSNSNLYEEKHTQMVGIRDIYFDADNGFYMNGTNLKLMGVCLHHDAGCLGGAVLPEIWLRRLLTLKEMGCNAIRMSHNPHMPELYDLCDILGFLVIDEAFDEWEGAKNKWSTGHNVYPPKHQGYAEDFTEWHERDLVDLVKRDRNHPSIIMWSIGNEIDYPNDPYCHPLFTTMTGNNDNNKPAAERQYDPNKPNAKRLSYLAKKLTDIVKENDATRPVSAAVAFPELSTKIGYIDSFDVVGYNYKEEHYANDHKRFPNKPFLGSENSHSLNAWKAVRDNEYISGQFLWTGIDYLGEAHGWPIHGSGAGLLTLAGFPKVSYYKRQSLWSKKPMIYLSTSRDSSDNTNEWKQMYRSWNYVPEELIHVRCYTNMPFAQLYSNGKSYGVKEYDDETGYISWLIPFEQGELRAIGYNLDDMDRDNFENMDSPKVTDAITSTGTACNILLNLWDSSQLETIYPNSFESHYDNLRDISIHPFAIKQVEVTITDGLGNLVTNDSTMLNITLSGVGELIGIENGDLADNIEYLSNYRRAYEGRLIAYIRVPLTKGGTTLTVNGIGLKTASLELSL